MSETKITPEEEHLLLVGAFKDFLRVGSFTFPEWSGMSVPQKAALAVAAEEVELERALLLARALTSEDEQLRLFSKIDGGDRFVGSKLVNAVFNFVSRKGVAG